MRAFAAAALAALALAGCRPGGRSDLAAPDPERRAAAVVALAGARDDEALAALVAATQDPHPRVRAAAARAFGVRGGVRAVEGLSTLLGDSDPEVTAAAARALAALGASAPGADARAVAEVNEKAARALAQAYGRGDSRTRLEIAAALKALGSSLREAVEAEARLLWERNVRELAGGSAAGRAGAAEELGRSGRAEATRALLPLVEDDNAPPELVAGAARGLGWSGDRAAVDVLAAALRGRDARVSESAAWALGRIGEPSAADALADAGHQAPARVGRSAVAALAALPATPAVGMALCEVAVRATDPAVAGAAAAGARERAAECPERALAQRIGRGGAEALGSLAALEAMGLPADRVRAPAEKALGLISTSTDPRVRAGAARALGGAGFQAAVPALQRRQAAIEERAARAGRGTASPAAVEPADVEELVEISVALSRLEPQRPAALATRLSAAADPRLRAGAARSLGAARSPGAVELLGPLATDADPTVRAAAVAAMGRLGPPGVEGLARVLSRPVADPGELSGIARALGDTASPAAVPHLTTLLAGPAAAAAATSLGAIGDAAAIPALVAALGRPGALGRLETVEALAQLNAAVAGPELTAELVSDRPEVRAAAARALGRLRHEAAAGWLEALRSDYHAEVRRAALEAVARLPAASPRRP
ncbi:MAG TPA: HEAT repeat domain-containing protein [Anaeromyxobacteraceae bacterium]|nr:HEAT repeat domain-containing protein [Anaeromyxobacteraceae bacterium]